ncbi:twin-arginine translocation signal domain-containing protein, partial [Candidatus Latescibacterota bacterium]
MNHQHGINRRDFIKTGAATVGGLALNTGNGYSIEQRPRFTCRKGTKLVGIYSNPNEVLNHPEYLDELQKKLGCNLIILSSGGVNYPEELRRLAPYPPEAKTWIGIPYNEDDGDINRCAEIVHSRGMDMWLSGSGHYDRGLDDSISPVDFNGELFRNHPLPKYAIEGGTGLCFQRRKVVRWQQNAYPWISGNYDIDGLYLSHHRYNTPSRYNRLWGCACDDCRRAAHRLGYDFDEMRSTMLKLRAGLESLTAVKVRHAAELGFTFTDLIQSLADGPGVLDWLEFRAAAFTDTFGAINRSIRNTTGGRCKFIIDTLNPTFMLLVGHDFKSFVGTATDAFYPMAWVDYHYVSIVASWANALVEDIDGLDEETALAAVYSLVGWNDIDLPRKRIADLHIGETGSQHKIPDFYKGFGKYVGGLMT